MFGPPDIVSADDRDRVFNTYILLALETFKSLDSSKQLVLLVSYDFSDGGVKYHHLASLDKLREAYTKQNSEDGGRVFDEQFACMEPDNGVIISVFHFAPRGAWCPSLYGCKSLDKLEEMSMKGKCPETRPINHWFNDSILYARFNPGYATHLFTKHLEKMKEIEDGSIAVLVCNDITEECTLTFPTLRSYLNDCKRVLVSKETMAFIRAKYIPKKMLIFNVINYLIDYFLVMEFTITLNRATIKYFSSPRDTSLGDEKTNHVDL